MAIMSWGKIQLAKSEVGKAGMILRYCKHVGGGESGCPKIQLEEVQLIQILILNNINTLALKTLSLQLSMKFLPV